MGYPITLSGFFRAMLDTLLGKKPRHKIPDDEDNSADIRDFYEFYYFSRDNDAGDEYWQKKAEEYIDRKEHEKKEAEKQMIEDYELANKGDTTEPEDEQSTSSKADDFHADIEMEFGLGFDADSDRETHDD